MNHSGNDDEFNRQVRNLIYTSIEDARCSAKYISNPEVFEEALLRERSSNTPRVTLIKMLESKIRQLNSTKPKEGME